MNPLLLGKLMSSPTLFIKISALAILTVAAFYFTKNDSTRTQIVFFSSSTDATPPPIAVSSNSDLNQTLTLIPTPSPPSPPPYPPPQAVEAAAAVPPPPPGRFGIVDASGAMADDFGVGEFDPDLEEVLDTGNGTAKVEEGGRVRVMVRRFRMCNVRMREYIPCLDNQEAIRKLRSTERGERFERHCPREGRGLDCLVPPPKGYKMPIPWPRSRDEVWYTNVPHTRLVEDKGGQNWISRAKDKFIFPGGGTQFIHGANQYLDQMSQMVPDISFGHHTRVALDIGCGVASFGAFLLSRSVVTLSIAPKDVHENQIQFALERGVPAMVAAFATHRLLYSSQSFDLIHCSRCRINWTRDV